jgi:hypothetical protein
MPAHPGPPLWLTASMYTTLFLAGLYPVVVGLAVANLRRTELGVLHASWCASPCSADAIPGLCLADCNGARIATCHRKDIAAFGIWS